jgi:hypothetical protein
MILKLMRLGCLMFSVTPDSIGLAMPELKNRKRLVRSWENRVHRLPGPFQQAATPTAIPDA